jgi:hypothetical protein
MQLNAIIRKLRCSDCINNSIRAKKRSDNHIRQGELFMKKRRKRQDNERVCIVLNHIQKEMLMQIADEERKSYSSIFRDGLELYFRNHIERQKVLSKFGL